MDEHHLDQVRQADTSDGASPVELWSLSRVEIRSPTISKARPAAWVELVHPVRGKVSDISRAPTTLEAVFAAAGQIVGLSPNLLSLDVQSSSTVEHNGLALRVELELELAGKIYRGAAFGVDLVDTALCAWLNACSCKVVSARPGAATARPYQVAGLDENGDLWIFASNDEGAAAAIMDEFRQEEFVEVRKLKRPLPGPQPNPAQ